MDFQILRKAGFKGSIFNAQSKDYQTLLKRMSNISEQNAGLITFATSAEDISIAVRFAVEKNLQIAIKCGGNHYSTANSTDGGLVIDMREIKDIQIDKLNMQVKVGGGCLWGDIYAALKDEDLACVGGGVHVVGVGGHVSGGGYGPLSYKFGMACDNILAAKVILADGRIVQATETENADLLWAIKGGSSSFGVISEFTLKTYPSQGPFIFRSLGFHAEAIDPILSRLSDFLKDDPSERMILPFLNFVRGPPPQHEPVLILNFFAIGAEEDHKDDIDSFLKAANPFIDRTERCPSLFEFSHAIDDILLFGAPRKLNGGALISSLWPGLAEDLWKQYLSYTNSNPDSIDSKVFLEFHHSRRLNRESTCIPIDVEKHHSIIILEEHHDPARDLQANEWIHSMIQTIRRYQKKHLKDLGINGNACGLYEKSEDIWGLNYPRLCALKAKYDPDQVFNKYFPIIPRP